MDIREIRSKISNVARDARNLDRLVQSEAFVRAWGAASEAQRLELQGYVLGIDKHQVDRWVKKVLSATNIEDKSVRELRELGRAAGINYVNQKSKDQIISELRAEEQP